MSAKNELRLTDTNAASDSKGRTWGLEGGLFWWLIGGIGASGGTSAQDGQVVAAGLAVL